ncbi:MAG: hypothetical protein ACTSWD_12870 [Candidatus Heimdallarchaeota archaeon]
MKKIKWSNDELKSIKEDYVVCNTCGWLVTQPDEKLKECTNCGTSYIKTNSK